MVYTKTYDLIKKVVLCMRMSDNRLKILCQQVQKKSTCCASFAYLDVFLYIFIY